MVVWLTLTSFLGWLISTLTGGGSPLILIPVLSWFFTATAIPPIITIGMLFGNAHRVLLYWEKIDWQLLWWYLPGAVLGGSLGAYIFTKTEAEWLMILLGLLLIISGIANSFEKSQKLFQVKAWYFLPGGFIYAFLSGLLGSIGPLLNPFYLNYGLDKEEMVGSKSTHMIIVHLIKVITYAAFGALNWSHCSYGLLIGLAAFPGNWVGQKILVQMSQKQFKQIVLAFVALSGVFILWEKRALFSVFWSLSG
ncbi:sulfite exporter TauE/SafE family protein [Gloeocapsa sp. PCC 73106]|uniref:sulfite exporter TauE/SafE family protein n=1 Tax=Gloeocapsa sp. PCC 73106 TaxID=102232 RepID=UPI0002ACB82E|nr:sulfite exporter TauE/SafE family protein [Gloeocapsa sp. PCC 73106]ELS00004.1 putative permease [Gloeocapsa sp. PCC 73106]